MNPPDLSTLLTSTGIICQHVTSFMIIITDNIIPIWRMCPRKLDNFQLCPLLYQSNLAKVIRSSVINKTMMDGGSLSTHQSLNDRSKQSSGNDMSKIFSNFPLMTQCHLQCSFHSPRGNHPCGHRPTGTP